MTLHSKKFITLGLICLLLSGFFASTPDSAAGEVTGDFEAIAAVPAEHSLERVVFEEFLNFTCPHCNNFRAAAKPLFAKYGKRLEHRIIPILFRGQPDTPLRLYFIADKEGRGEEIKNMLFDASFLYGVNIYDPAMVNYLAKSAGLGEAYERDAQAEWVTTSVMEAQRRAALVGVQATPTVVLQSALRVEPKVGMQTFVNTLDQIIAQLLK